FSMSTATTEHPLKMSFSKLTIKPDGYVDIEARIFWDDLTEHLERQYRLEQPDFTSITAKGTQTFQQYLEDHFYFDQDGKKIKLWVKSISFSDNKLALVVNLSTTDLLDITKEIYLVNTLLCDASPQQKNNVRYRDEHFILSLSKKRTKIYFN
ncbi:MAG: DUF6702 family protein, partial [Cyanobacteria bacterium J06649_11]